jgi:glutamine cyclotransferase
LKHKLKEELTLNQQHIHCIVKDCHYYTQGNICSANEILVATDQFGRSQPDKIDCEMAKEISPQPAGTCMETCCKTYVSSGSDKITADGVKKLK